MTLLALLELLTITALTVYFFCRGKLISDKLLSLFYLVLSINFLSTFFTVSGYYDKQPQLLFLDMGIPIILGPLFWFYVNSLSRNKKHFDNNYWFHFLPLIFYYVMFMDLILLPGEEKLIISESTVTDMSLRWKIASIFQLIPVPVYLLVSLKELRLYNRRIKNIYSNIEAINLGWLRYLLAGFTVLWLLVSISIVMVNFRESLVPAGIIIFNSAFFLFGIITGAYAIKRNRRISYLNFVLNDPQTRDRSQGEDNELLELVKNSMQEDELFSDPDLSLAGLASKIGIEPYRLSRLLNEKFELSFFDFINQYRLEYFIDSIKRGENRQYTIISLAYDSGFNSKSAFYRAFKSYTGTTPNNYIRKLESAE